MKSARVPSSFVLARARDGRRAHAALLPPESAACALRSGAAAQADFRAARLAAKRAAARLLGLSPADWPLVESRAHRGPLLRAQAHLAQMPVAVSYAHCAKRAVAVAAPPRVRVGVDLERAGSVSPAARRFFLSAHERASLRCHDQTQLWCVKEAAWKALTLGSLLPFHALELVIDAEGSLRGLRLDDRFLPARAALRRPWPGWIAALVWLDLHVAPRGGGPGIGAAARGRTA